MLELRVFNSFVSGESLKLFIAVTVKPALSCASCSTTEDMRKTMHRFMAILAGDQASEEDAISLKLACSVLSGELSSHPLIQGLMLACHRLLDKESRGVTSRSGRWSKHSEREKSLIQDAGLTLALFGGNAELARQFGLASTSCKISFDILRERSLPTPALGILWDDVMKENWLFLDQISPRTAQQPRGYLAELCFLFVFL